MTKFKKTLIKIAVSFFAALFFLFQSPSPILATAVTDTYTDTAKINTSASSTYAISGGQAKILSLGGNAGWWKMDEASGTSVADYWGTTNGTANGTTVVAGQHSNARNFNGTSDWVNLGSNKVGPLINGASQVTVSLWVKPSAFPALSERTRAFSVNIDDVAGPSGVLVSLYNDAGTIKAEFIGRSVVTDTAQISRITYTGALNEWHHIAGVYNYPSDTITPYLDGTPGTPTSVTFGNTTYTQGTFSTNYEDSIGAGRSTSTFHFFGGAIDNVMIYNYGRSQAEIQADMNNTAGPAVVAGQYGNARSFNGTSDYVEVPDHDSLDLSTAFTLEAWVYRTVDSGTWERILSKSMSDSYDYWLQVSNDDTYSCGVVKGDASSYSRNSSGTISTGTWTHLACSFDSTNGFNLYIDGSLSNGTASGTVGAARTSTRNFQIGRLGSGSAWYYNLNGKVDDIRIYNYVRTATQIANDKNNTNYEPSATIQSTNLLLGEASIISSIDNFVYNLSSRPAGTTATVQFSQDASNWYNSTGTLNGTDTLITGANNTISFTALGWDTANFYYKIAFGGDTTNTPVLDDITLNYTTTGTCTTPPAGGGNYTVSTNCAFAPTSETSIVRDLGSTPGHGNITGTSVVPGKYGSARKFNGSSDYLSIPDSTALDITGDFTISAWANRAGTGNNSLVSKVAGSPPSGGGYGLLTGNAGEVYCRTSDGPGWTDSYTATGLLTTSSGWTHLAIVRTGTSCRVWVNGVDRTQTANTHTTVTANASNLTIGRRTDGSEYFNGQIDDVRIYNYARTTDQIKDDMNETPITTNLPVGWWKMDDGYIGGVDNGNITVQAGKTLTVNAGQTIVWNPGKSIIIENGASIAINLRSRLKQAYLWHTDADRDTYPAATSKLRWADTTPGQSVRWYLANAATDCNDSQNGPNRCCWERPSGTCNSGCNSNQEENRATKYCPTGSACGNDSVTCYLTGGCVDGQGSCYVRGNYFEYHTACYLPSGVCTLSNANSCYQSHQACTWSW